MQMQSETQGTSGARDAAAAKALEREAFVVGKAMTGSRAERLRIGARALWSLLRDPDDTQQVFLLYLSLNAERYPAFLARFAHAPGGLDMLSERPAIDSKHVDYAALRALPDGTLGREYARFLDANKLDPDLFHAPPGLPEAPAFLSQRMRQTHDLWHVLTGYTPDVPGEVALQAFTYAQTGMPGPALVAVAGTARWMLKHREMPRATWQGYQRGMSAVFLPAVRWEELWSLPLAEVRERVGIAVH